ncbi:MAG: hypothetical protein UT24_C0030G0013 [Candidatus Woesebacteria bacterium GW2011_GWB1_39_12]|uniref:tRNAHis guanylyltransferase catalytic domain-containing protein n=1 Tax=Candidatus Woesebacteria bacterium GW2011_GWB1_39_12 TaxID=1618574 RepID=A0A0G0MF09_9BACT|nr:MAG: hypothetical protein UT24_C0030G0013 [Candidatus Woesebacteria bacterium GW2011_GWB1_39_12]
MGKDDLGDRMKRFERHGFGSEILLPQIPVIARLDGKTFHSFTRGLQKPFDVRLTELMHLTTKHLIDQFHPDLAFTQSDEITLVWVGDRELLFNGKVLKMCSSFSALASAFFCSKLPEQLPEKSHFTPTFDCRVFNLPTLTEAVNCLIWRQMDAVRNSVSGLAQANFSHKQLQNVGVPTMKQMLLEKGIRWEDLPADNRQGSFFRRVVFERKFTEEELQNLPENHNAHSNPDLLITRSEVRKIDLPLVVEMEDRSAILFPAKEKK